MQLISSPRSPAMAQFEPSATRPLLSRPDSRRSSTLISKPLPGESRSGTARHESPHLANSRVAALVAPTTVSRNPRRRSSCLRSDGDTPPSPPLQPLSISTELVERARCQLALDEQTAERRRLALREGLIRLAALCGLLLISPTMHKPSRSRPAAPAALLLSAASAPTSGPRGSSRLGRPRDRNARKGVVPQQQLWRGSRAIASAPLLPLGR
jgi:hypothetical protein